MSSHLHIENPTHPAYDAAYPYPAHSTHSVSSAYDPSSSPVDIQGVRRSSITWMTPTVESSEGPLIRHTIAPPHESLEQPVRGEMSRRTLIDMLPAETLLEIFDFYRLDSLKRSRRLVPHWKWHPLTQVCQKWRRAIFMSPSRLGLRIFCKSRSPVESILASWPTLPLVVRYNAPKSKSLPKNIVAALRRPDHICEIDLILSNSLIGSIAELIREPLHALEFIQIKFKDTTGPPTRVLFSEAFLGGSAPRLRGIRLDGIAIPFLAIQPVLSSTNNLVELYLPNIPHDGYFSPDVLVTGLSTLVRLKWLTVGFLSPASSPPPSVIRSPPERTTLPSLTFLDFHGASEYLEEFAAQIDLPVLCKINIRLFNDMIFEIPQFCQVLLRRKALGPPTVAHIIHSQGSVGITAFPEGKSLYEECILETSCRRFDGQLSFMTQISSQLSSFLSRVRVLYIRQHRGMPTGEEDVDSTQWLELFQPYTHVTEVRVMVPSFAPGIAQALVAEDMAAGVLPELTSLGLSGYRSSPSAVKAAEQLVATRRLSGQNVSLSG